MMVRFIQSLIFGLTHGFGKKLRPYEERIFAHVLSQSTSADSESLQAQISNLAVVQRSSKDQMVIFGFMKRDQIPLIADQSLEHCFSRLTIAMEERQLVATVMTHRGLLSSLEFSKPPSAVLIGEFSILAHSSQPMELGLSSSINKVEHEE